MRGEVKNIIKSRVGPEKFNTHAKSRKPKIISIARGKRCP